MITIFNKTINITISNIPNYEKDKLNIYKKVIEDFTNQNLKNIRYVKTK